MTSTFHVKLYHCPILVDNSSIDSAQISFLAQYGQINRSACAQSQGISQTRANLIALFRSAGGFALVGRRCCMRIIHASVRQ